jgi:hypothetical protein
MTLARHEAMQRPGVGGSTQSDQEAHGQDRPHLIYSAIVGITPDVRTRGHLLQPPRVHDRSNAVDAELVRPPKRMD